MDDITRYNMCNIRTNMAALQAITLTFCHTVIKMLLDSTSVNGFHRPAVNKEARAGCLQSDGCCHCMLTVSCQRHKLIRSYDRRPLLLPSEQWNAAARRRSQRHIATSSALLAARRSSSQSSDQVGTHLKEL